MKNVNAISRFDIMGQRSPAATVSPSNTKMNTIHHPDLHSNRDSNVGRYDVDTNEVLSSNAVYGNIQNGSTLIESTKIACSANYQCNYDEMCLMNECVKNLNWGK